MTLVKTSILTLVLFVLCCLLGCVGWLVTGRVWQRTSCGRNPVDLRDRRDDSCKGGCHLCGGSDPDFD